jgi:hypothetical protein
MRCDSKLLGVFCVIAIAMFSNAIWAQTQDPSPKKETLLNKSSELTHKKAGAKNLIDLKTKHSQSDAAKSKEQLRPKLNQYNGQQMNESQVSDIALLRSMPSFSKNFLVPPKQKKRRARTRRAHTNIKREAIRRVVNLFEEVGLNVNEMQVHKIEPTASWQKNIFTAQFTEVFRTKQTIDESPESESLQNVKLILTTSGRLLIHRKVATHSLGMHAPYIEVSAKEAKKAFPEADLAQFVQELFGGRLN